MEVDKSSYGDIDVGRMLKLDQQFGHTPGIMLYTGNNWWSCTALLTFKQRNALIQLMKPYSVHFTKEPISEVS
jgi:hypothetical protein